MSLPRVIGELAIVAYKARDLPNREIAGKQDPFVVFQLGGNTRQTKTDYRGGQHPIWDDQINMPVPEKKKEMLVQVYDEDAKRKDLISELDLDITKVLEEGEHDGWFPLHFKNRKAGEIYLEMTFYSAAPPPKRQPTRYGVKPKKQSAYAHPPVPHPYPPTSIQPQHPVNMRPLPSAPVGSHTHYPYPSYNGYPPAVATTVQHPMSSRPVSYSGYPTSISHSPPKPTHTISSGQTYPIHSRPTSYPGQQMPSNNLHGQIPPPNSTPNSHLTTNTSHAPLLSSPYNPGSNATVVPPHHNQAHYPPPGVYPPYPNNRQSFPQQNGTYYPSNVQGHPHNGYPVHQGSRYSTQGNYVPHNYQSAAYPSKSGYPPY